MKKLKLNLGSGVHLMGDGFTNVDKFFSLKDLQEGARTKKGLYQGAVIPKDAKFVQADMCDLPFKDNSADYVESYDSIEHVAFRLVPKALMEMYRVLKPKGKLRIMTTNFDNLAQRWMENIANNPKPDTAEILNLQEIIYGNQAGPGEFHCSLFNPTIMGMLLQGVGFKGKNIIMKIFPTGNTEANDMEFCTWKSGERMYRSEMLQVTCVK